MANKAKKIIVVKLKNKKEQLNSKPAWSSEIK